MDGTASHADMKARHRHDARYAMAESGTDASGPHAAAQRLRGRAPAPESRLAELQHQAAELTVHIDSLRHAFERSSDEGVRAHLGYLIRLKSGHLAELEDETTELERMARDACGPLRLGQVQPPRSHVQPAPDRAAAPGGSGRIRETAPGRYPGAVPKDSGPAGDATSDHVLAGRWIEQVSAHESNVAATTDIYPDTAPDQMGETHGSAAGNPGGPGLAYDAVPAAGHYVPPGSMPPASAPSGSAAPEPSRGHTEADPGGQMPSPEERTGDLVSHGRHSAYRPRLSPRHKAAIGAAAVAVLITIVVAALVGGSASWPSSVATVQSEAARACQNPNVASEPSQVNFACTKDTRQILWVFALMTSGDNPHFADANTGRVGLEPITPTLGGEVALSLNLHHPYNPGNPVDSLAVVARAINDIIGGATVTGSNGKPVVQPGLESYPANCARYTGSAAVVSRRGFPGRCASPVTSPGGQAALVADVYSKWIVGSAPWAAHDAAVLFENAANPGNPQVQAILRKLRHSKPLA